MMSRLVILIFGFFLFVLEYYLSSISWQITTNIISVIFYFLTFSIFVITLFLIFFKLEKASIIIILVGFISVVPFNIYFQNELTKLKTESDDIIYSVYKFRAENNYYPKNIKVNNKIKYSFDDDGFTVFFYVTTQRIGYFYSSKDGWNYMGD